jgi:hypothetical protein
VSFFSSRFDRLGERSLFSAHVAIAECGGHAVLKKGVVSTPFSRDDSIAALPGNRKDDRGDCDRPTSETSRPDFGNDFWAIAAWLRDAIGTVRT